MQGESNVARPRAVALNGVMERVVLLLLSSALAGTPQGHQDHMRHQFDPERDLARFENPERERWQKPDEVIAALKIAPGQKVADIGAGTGYFSVRLAKLPAKPAVYAADLETKMVEFLRERAAKERLTNITAVQASEKSPNLPEAMDLILIVNTYHHIGSRVDYFRTLKKSLRPGGRVAIVDWKKDAPMGPPEPFRFSPEQIENEMRQAGYRLTASHDFLPYQNFLEFQAAPGN